MKENKISEIIFMSFHWFRVGRHTI